jgi:hypothetical protein
MEKKINGICVREGSIEREITEEKKVDQSIKAFYSRMRLIKQNKLHFISLAFSHSLPHSLHFMSC